MPNLYTGTLNNPVSEAQHQYLGKDWERYFQALNGKNVRYAPTGSLASFDPGVRPGDDDVYRNLLANGPESDVRRREEAAVLARANAGPDPQQADQEALDRALQTGGQAPRAIQQNPDGSYATAPQGAPATPAEQRANILKMVPGHVGMAMQKQWAAQDAAQAVADETRAKQSEIERHNRATEEAASGAGDDVTQAVGGMKEGSIPPQLPGRASKDYTKVMAEARRQGYDLAGAATDWIATQKHIASMNSTQQLRLNQAVNQLPELLDSVDELATKWKGGKFPLLNKANIALAKNGAFGSDAASIANQLDSQISHVTADLGTVYMGGNSPTDHGLGLAGKTLSADWDEKVLHDAIGLAKKNVQIRQNSVRNTGVSGASAGNPYDKAATAEASGASTKDPLGIRKQ